MRRESKLSARPPVEGGYVTSAKPGITVFSRPEDCAVMLSSCIKYGYPLSRRQVKQISPNLSRISLPRGGFVTYPFQGQIQFWQIQGEDKGEGLIEGNHGLFLVPAKRVVRIQGKSRKSAEVWQNPRYLADGSLNSKFDERDEIAALGPEGLGCRLEADGFLEAVLEEGGRRIGS